MVYESAIDAWVGILLFMTPFVAAVIGIYAWIIGQPGDASILFAAGGLALLIMLAFSLPCRYTLLEDALSIRCGLMVRQIPFADIQSVKLSSSWKSGPALSLRRVAVRTGRRVVILSPRDREEFIDELRQRIAKDRL